MTLKEAQEKIIKDGIRIGFPQKEIEKFFKEEDNNIKIKLEEELPHLSESYRNGELADQIETLLRGKNLNKWIEQETEKAKKGIQTIIEDLKKNPQFSWDNQKERLIQYLTSREEELKLNQASSGWGENGERRRVDPSLYESCVDIGLWLSENDGNLYRYRCVREGKTIKEIKKLGLANDLEYIIYFPFLAEKAGEIVNELKELSTVAS